MTALRRGAIGLGIATVVLGGLTPAGHADNLAYDGDYVSGAGAVSLGSVCRDDGAGTTIGFDLVRQGSANAQVWGNGAVVTVTPGSPSASSGGTLTPGSAATTMPADWTERDNGAVVGAGPAQVSLTVPAGAPVGAASSTVTYTASGAGAERGTVSRSTPVTFSWTVIDCQPTDTTPPSVDYTLDPAVPDGDNGWYRSDVTIDWTVTDEESDVTLEGCEDATFTTDGTHESSCTATSAGGTTGPVSVTVKRDATVPDVTWTSGPEDGSSYYYGDPVPAAACEATDVTSGVTDAGCSVTGGGTAVGEHTLTASATDNAGNEGSASRTYNVLAWTLEGFYKPVNMGALNTVKSGSTVPLKFNVFKGSTELTSDIGALFSVTRIGCSASEVVDAYPETLLTTGGTSLRYDATGGQWVQNWATPSGAKGKCYRVTLTTADGSSTSADFQLR